MSRRIWTNTAYDVLYEKLKKYDTSAYSNAHAFEKDEDFMEWAYSFSIVIGAKSERAVIQQIAFGLTTQDINTLSPGLASTMTLNKFFAKKHGII